MDTLLKSYIEYKILIDETKKIKCILGMLGMLACACWMIQITKGKAQNKKAVVLRVRIGERDSETHQAIVKVII